nr:hypothetical protein [Pedobacter kyonggii]
MYKFYFVALIIISSTTLTEAQSPHKIAITNFATINFPSQPIISDTLDVKMYQYSDSVADYLVMIKDMRKLKGFQLKSENLSDFYRGLEESTLKGDKATLISKKPFIIDNLKGFEMAYVGSQPNLPNLKFKRAIFIDGIIISIDFMTSVENKLRTQANREIFFSSFSITGQKHNLKQGTVDHKEDSSQSFSYILGKLIGYAFVIIFIIWICKAFRTK